jgi:hypothetical protein
LTEHRRLEAKLDALMAQLAQFMSSMAGTPSIPTSAIQETGSMTSRKGKGEVTPALQEDLPRTSGPGESRGTTSTARRTPKSSTVKLRDLPRLGKEKGELPYYRWKVEAKAIIHAAKALPVLEEPLPSEEADSEYFTWYEEADAVVYAALLAAVRGIPVLSDAVRRLQGKKGSAQQAWKVMADHYIRLVDTNLTMLNSKLLRLQPLPGESMESFLNRCQLLRDEYADYDQQLDDVLLITQVFTKLSHQWKQSTGFNKVSLRDQTWADVAQALQTEDNSRRQCEVSTDESLLPLGWKERRRGKGGLGMSAGVDQDGTALDVGNRGRSPPPGAGRQDRGRSPGKDRVRSRTPGPRGKSPGLGFRSPGRQRGGRGGNPYEGLPFVCYHCLKTGHSWLRCPTRPRDWAPDQAAKDRADRVRGERGEQSSRDRAIHLARVSGSSTGSGSGSVTPRIGQHEA